MCAGWDAEGVEEGIRLFLEAIPGGVKILSHMHETMHIHAHTYTYTNKHTHTIHAMCVQQIFILRHRDNQILSPPSALLEFLQELAKGHHDKVEALLDRALSLSVEIDDPITRVRLR